MKAVRSTRRVNSLLKKSISIWKRVIITMWRHQQVNARIGFGRDPLVGEVTAIDEAGEMSGNQRYLNIDPLVQLWQQHHPQNDLLVSFESTGQ
jgi:hypothetical protein